jgi:hypothetical protein
MSKTTLRRKVRDIVGTKIESRRKLEEEASTGCWVSKIKLKDEARGRCRVSRMKPKKVF